MVEPFTYSGQTILSHPIFVETILPFLLVFVIVFAVLEKSKIFGEGKRQIDALVGLVVALLVISFANTLGVIIQLIPFLAVSLVILVVLMILLGSFWSEDKMPKSLQYILMVVVIIAVVVAVTYYTGAWQYLIDLVYSGGGAESSILLNVFFVVIIAAAIGAVIWKGKSGDN